MRRNVRTRTGTRGVTRAVALAVVAAAWLGAGPASAQQGPDTEVRALWITRWDYTEPQHVRAIIRNTAAMNFNVALFQVRGNGTAFYRSQIEPWAWELTSKGPETTGKDPGWDPLELAIREAKRHGIELHAYVNVFPAWLSQRYPPRDSGQLWWERPHWFMCDAAGGRMIPRDQQVNPDVRDWYSFISPGVPEVQDYLAGLFEELVSRYEVDGLHYDYIRYPREIREVAEGYEERAAELGNWSYDAVSLARFARETGVAAPDLDPERWVDWRAEQISETVRKIDERVRSHRPGLVVSAAVMADPHDARQTKFQDYLRWMQRGHLDVAVTMNYTGNDETFRQRSQMLLEARPQQGLAVVGMSLAHEPEQVVRQIEMTRELGTDGFACFAYSRLFDRDAGHKPRELSRVLREGPLARGAKLPWASREASRR